MSEAVGNVEIPLRENGKAVYQDVCYPVTKEFREKLFNVILDTYEKEKAKQQAQEKNQSKEHFKEEYMKVDSKNVPFR